MAIVQVQLLELIVLNVEESDEADSFISPSFTDEKIQTDLVNEK